MEKFSKLRNDFSNKWMLSFKFFTFCMFSNHKKKIITKSKSINESKQKKKHTKINEKKNKFKLKQLQSIEIKVKSTKIKNNLKENNINNSTFTLSRKSF